MKNNPIQVACIALVILAILTGILNWLFPDYAILLMAGFLILGVILVVIAAFAPSVRRN